MTKPKSYYRQMEEKYGHLGDRVKCRICGEIYIFLGVHVAKTHKMTAEQYKDEFDLLHLFPLCTEELSSDFSSSTKKNIEKGKLKTTNSFLVSERNKGIRMSDVSKKVIGDKNRHPKNETAKRNMSVAAKSRTEEHNQKIGLATKKYWLKKAVFLNCSVCGEPVRVTTQRMKQSHVFCNKECFMKYMKNPNNSWLGRNATPSNV